MTFPTGFQSFIDSSTPTPANLLEQQPFASTIFTGGRWGRGQSQNYGSSSVNPFTVWGRCHHILSSIVPRQCLLICRFFALNAFSALGSLHGEGGELLVRASFVLKDGEWGTIPSLGSP